MIDSPAQVQRLLSTLAAHADIITDALKGTVYAGQGRDKALDTLAAVRALMPYEEGVYQLNPRLRNFISDHLGDIDAGRSLTRLNNDILEAQRLWAQIRELVRDGEPQDAERLEISLDATITSISYAVDRNLMVLNANLSTDYGNVVSFKAKRQQNRLYSREVKISLAEIRKLDLTMETIEREAFVAGMLSVRQAINSRIRSRLHTWSTRLNEVQHQISKRLAHWRQLEQRIQNLGNMALWLNQNRLSAGFEVEVTERVPLAVIGPHRIKVRSTVDVQDTDAMVREGLANAVARLPERQAPRAAKSKEPQIVLVEDRPTVVEELQRTPADDLIDNIAVWLGAIPARSTTLLKWKKAQSDLSDVSDEEWLLYASSQLITEGYKTHLINIENNRMPGGFNDLFIDVIASNPN